MLYQRKILKILAHHLSDKEAIVLTGMRRVGKTTVYRMLFDSIESPNKLFLDLENPLIQKTFEEKDYHNIIANLKGFGLSEKSKAYVFLDEIQAMPEITKIVKYLYDHYDIKFFLTGSSSFYLKNLFPESLAGRKFVFELHPLDFEEFLIFKDQSRAFSETLAEKARDKNEIRHEKLKKLYDEYVECGGFPEAVLTSERGNKELKLQDIFKSYFEHDVRMLADFRNINLLRDTVLLLAGRIGSKVEITKLASEIGVSRETIYSFLSFLEHTYFVRFITPFTKNVDREISGARKVYFCDTGLARMLTPIGEGSLFENAVFLNLAKYGTVNYYQKRTGGEIDFIIDKKIAVEVKTKGTDGDFQRIDKYASALLMREQYVVTREYRDSAKCIPATDL